MKTALILTAISPDDRLLGLLEELRETDEIVPVVICRENADALPENVVALKPEGARGKGAAIRYALEYVRDNMPECGFVIRAEADGRYGYEDIMHLNKFLVQHRNTLVLGKRAHNHELSVGSILRSATARQIFAVASGRDVHDIETGLRGFSRRLLDRFIHVDGDAHEYEVNVLLYAARSDIKIVEIPISAPVSESRGTYWQHLKQWITVYACVMKFAASSLITFLMDLFTLLGLNYLLRDMHEVAALIISVGVARVISSLANFYINHFLVFDSNEPVGNAMLKFGMLQAVIMLGSYALMHLLNITLNVPLAVSKVISDSALFVVSFFVQGKLIYNKED